MIHNRRDFLRGAWRAREHSGDATAGVLVQVRPERLPGAEQAIRALGGITIESRDPRGRLALAVETAAVAATLGALAQFPEVLSATLINPMNRPPGAKP